ncbi:MAG: division/cell wall cluster transcriptional repressor MraZ [Actinobacteria bacterium]|nr:division/cell wall cluster transcriptional repressor MraZ [Actinomycetota bacterium]MCI0545077.1 division/cell wall cluster transcriptional repressor MraZ [Actinomycetota bacterium]MCI0677711.1 division/cell wall cluster transcriptional repressor MraZ [Actinomycetota bacterium]
MFLGEYSHSLDDKGRVVLPSSYRSQLDDGCVLTKGRDGQLMIYPVEVFRRLAEEVRAQPQDRKGRRVSRTVFAGADHQGLDKSGRVLIKPDLREFAGLTTGSEISVLGVYEHIELWDSTRYSQERVAGDESYVDEEG